MDIRTLAVHGSRGDEKTGALSFPIFQTSTFRHPGLNQSTGYDYTRTGNPTRNEAEKAVALLENAKEGISFSSGMAAVTALMHLFAPGDHVLVSDDLYGGTYRVMEQVYRAYGIDFTYVDTSNLMDVEKAWAKNTRAVFLESPTNPMMKVCDISAICALAKHAGAISIVDNTLMTPCLQQPLNLGADIAVHSGTKYLAGHNDTLAGFIAINDTKLAEKLKFFQNAEGAVLSPFDSWLVLRGLKTLAIRVERQQQNAMEIAHWLQKQLWAEEVYYPGLPGSPYHALQKKQARGFGGMLSFAVKDIALVGRMLENVKIVSYAESLGGVESLITYPVLQTHAAIPEELRVRIGITDKLLRLSVGIEAVEDIIADLNQAASCIKGE
jgi:cystathionine gamma-synthase